MNFVTLLIIGFILGLILKAIKKSLRFVVSVVIVFVLVAYLLQLVHILYNSESRVSTLDFLFGLW